MSITRSMRQLTVVALALLILGSALPAHATREGTFSFVAQATLPDFPCARATCQVSSLSGRVVGAIVGTGPNGATVCAAPTCALSEGPVGITYEEPPCFPSPVFPLQGSAFGQAEVNGGTTVGPAGQTPLVLNIDYIRIGVVAIVTFRFGQVGAAAGIFVPGAGVDCISGNGPATVQIIGAGVIESSE